MGRVTAIFVRIVAILIPLLFVRGLYGAFLVLAGRDTKWSEVSGESDRATIVLAAVFLGCPVAFVIYYVGKLFVR